jgi:hypothetical protein
MLAFRPAKTSSHYTQMDIDTDRDCGLEMDR